MLRLPTILFALCCLFPIAALLPVSADDTVSSPVAWVDIGNINVDHGLSLLNGGDGQNDSCAMSGLECRKNITEGNFPSYYLYFDYDTRAARLQRPVYISIEYFDEGFGFFRIQYDSADIESPDHGVYKEGATEILLDSRRWRKVIFELPDARFGNRQNLGADFRLYCSGTLAVRKAAVFMGSCPDFALQSHEQGKRMAACAGKLAPTTNFKVVFSGLEPSHDYQIAQCLADMRVLAPMMKALGATSVESNVRWDMAEPVRGRWDWSYYDAVVSILRENGLKWNPYIIAGPAYATPEWFKSSQDSVFAKCLEHNSETKVQSVWNPALPWYIDRFISEFAKHYGGSGSIESILLGVSGDFGEAIYPVTGGGLVSPDEAEYHSHPGYWCGDVYAQADFRRQIEAQYESIEALNSAWGTNIASFDDLTPSVPDSNESARERLDFLKWYRGRMSKWSYYWLTSVRSSFPVTDLYLCTGGNGQPSHGSDFSAQCKAAAKVNAGIRINNEGSDYALNFASTRLVASAARFYKGHLATEAAGAISSSGIVARAYNAITSKCRGIHVYYPTVLTQPGGIACWSNSYRSLSTIITKKPQVAVLYPQTSLSLKWGGFQDKIMLLRDLLDFDLIDPSMIRDGALSRYKAIVILDGKVIEREDADRIITWGKNGGVIVSCDFGGFIDVEGAPSSLNSIFDTSSGKTISTKALGTGLALYVTENWDSDTKPVSGIAQALNSLSNRFQVNLVPDGQADRVYVTDCGNGFLIYNSTGVDVEREVQTGIGGRRKVKLPAYAITKIPD